MVAIHAPFHLSVLSHHSTSVLIIAILSDPTNCHISESLGTSSSKPTDKNNPSQVASIFARYRKTQPPLDLSFSFAFLTFPSNFSSS
ncbi:MAG: hypothetical protein H6767_08605 [Candidatus Peribacteria bacterium]|nr:MAG: hypothetical protein H6767_08605 [Candidatus Peribacteria bacterium]